MHKSVKQKLIKRLTGYWKMEAGNIVLMPALMLFLTEARISLWTGVATIAMALLLGIGALYWRAKLQQLQGRDEKFESTMSLIRRMRLPSLALTGSGVGFCALLWLRPEFSKGRPDQIAATFMAVLALLEYINYYHRQLQYFDNMADLKRVFSGKGFRPSQMRRDLDQIARRKRSLR